MRGLRTSLGLTARPTLHARYCCYTAPMHKAQAVRLNKRAVVRFLMLLVTFGLVGALLLWLKVATANTLELALPNELQDFVTLALSIVVEALPFVVLGALVSAVIRLFGATQRLMHILPKRPLIRRLSISLLGTFMPVCECGNVPVARGLVIRGMSVSESMTFLLAAPILNPVTLLSTSQAFRLDPSIVWIRMVGALLIANLVGGLIALHKNQMELVSKGFYNTLCEVELAENPGHHHDHSTHHHHHGPAGRASRLREGIVVFRDEVSLMLKMLCLGAVIAG
jgi:uncharacterized protein